MSRLPSPGADGGVWGDILNDFLQQEHGKDGSLKLRSDGTFEPWVANGTVQHYWRGDKTWQTLNKSAIGLDQVDNTSDVNKPVSIAAQSALNSKVSKTGDTLTGTLSFPANAGLTFVNANRFLRYDTSEGKTWLGTAADNEKLKLTFGGAGGYLQFDQYGQGEVARFSNGSLTMNNAQIHGVAMPTSSQDVATKGYVDAAVIPAISTKSTNYTIVGTDHTILVNASSGALTMTLPSAIGTMGQSFVIKKIDASVNPVLAATVLSQTIDGAVNVSLASRWKYITVQSDGANWFIIANN